MTKIRQLISLISVLTLVLCFSVTICLPAKAVLREHHDSGVIRYHSQNSLKDQQGYTWQVVLFPVSQSFDSVTKYHLRLVGFPGIAEFIHPQSLQIITANGEIFQAVDSIAISPAPNVGEFDVTNILPLLSPVGSLKLLITVYDKQDLSISIPKSTLIEWQWLIK